MVETLKTAIHDLETQRLGKRIQQVQKLTKGVEISPLRRLSNSIFGLRPGSLMVKNLGLSFGKRLVPLQGREINGRGPLLNDLGLSFSFDEEREIVRIGLKNGRKLKIFTGSGRYNEKPSFCEECNLFSSSQTHTVAGLLLLSLLSVRDEWHDQMKEFLTKVVNQGLFIAKRVSPNKDSLQAIVMPEKAFSGFDHFELPEPSLGDDVLYPLNRETWARFPLIRALPAVCFWMPNEESYLGPEDQKPMPLR